MTPEKKHKWLLALTQGNYSQGRRILRNDYKTYCCLGVLCDISPEAGKWNGSLFEKVMLTLPSDLAIGMPCPIFRNPTSPEVLLNGEYEQLAALNDRGYPFCTIA